MSTKMEFTWSDSPRGVFVNREECGVIVVAVVVAFAGDVWLKLWNGAIDRGLHEV